MSELKILLFNIQMEAAGAQKAMLTLARGLQQRGHTVTVATMYDKAAYVELFRKQYGVNIVDLHMKPPAPAPLFKKFKSAITGLVKLSRLIRQEKFDVVQTFSPYSNLIGPVVAYGSGVPVRVSSQRSSLRNSPAWLLFLDRVVANSFLVQKMVAVSEATRIFSINVQKIQPEKLVTIRNSIDLDRFSPSSVRPESLPLLRQDLKIPQHAFTVICVARLQPQKGHRFLIEAIPAVQERIPNVHFLFVGEGGLRQDLLERVQAVGAEKLVHFLGMRQDIPELLALSDVLVLPSLWEGMPNCLLEAMAMELPVIATNVDGSPELIRDSETGILVPPRDPAALAQAICLLFDDIGLRQKMGRAARAWAVEEFSAEKNISSFIQLYECLVASRAKRH